MPQLMADHTRPWQAGKFKGGRWLESSHKYPSGTQARCARSPAQSAAGSWGRCTFLRASSLGRCQPPAGGSRVRPKNLPCQFGSRHTHPAGHRWTSPLRCALVFGGRVAPGRLHRSLPSGFRCPCNLAPAKSKPAPAITTGSLLPLAPARASLSFSCDAIQSVVVCCLFFFFPLVLPDFATFPRPMSPRRFFHFKGSLPLFRILVFLFVVLHHLPVSLHRRVWFRVAFHSPATHRPRRDLFQRESENRNWHFLLAFSPIKRPGTSQVAWAQK